MGPKKEAKKQVPVVQQVKPVQPQIPLHQLEGFGRFQYQNGIIYQGQWKLINKIKVKYGQGQLIIPGTGPNKFGEQKYKGNWKDDKQNGYGIYHYASGAIYTGQWKDGKHHGKGTYQFADGSIYEGQWENHKMHGQGLYIDTQDKKWQGQFSNGAFQSKLQNELRAQKQIKKKQLKILNESQTWFSKFLANFAKSDKKTYKQNLIQFFAIQQEAKTHVKDPFPKFQQKTPEKWNQSINILKDFTQYSILKTNSASKFLEPQRILSKQFEGLGQIIQYKYVKQQRIIRCSLCLVLPQVWVLVFYHDNLEPEKKK